MTLSQIILSKIVNLYILNKGVYGNISTTSIEETLKAELSYNLNELEKYQNYLQLNNIEHLIIIPKYFEENLVPMTFKEGNNQSKIFFNLFEASQQILSKSFKLLNSPLNEFNFRNPLFFFVSFNLINDYFVYINMTSKYFVDDLLLKSKGNKSFNYGILFSSIFVITFFIIFIIPIHKKMILTETEVIYYYFFYFKI